MIFQTVGALVSRPVPRSRSVAPYVDDTEEPEFIRVQRMLRRSTSRDELQADITPMSRTYRNRILSPISSESSKSFKPKIHFNNCKKFFKKRTNYFCI